MNRKGFTLVEVLIVLAIIALLVLILVPNVFIMIDKNNEKSCNNIINNIESAAKLYVTNNKYDLEFGCNTSNNTKKIKLQKLVETGDLILDSEGKLTNPVTETAIPLLETEVEVTYNCDNKEFTYNVKGIVCTK